MAGGKVATFGRARLPFVVTRYPTAPQEGNALAFPARAANTPPLPTMDFLDELRYRILPGDGAMGTLLMDAGLPLETCFEALCLTQPEQVSAIHEAYLAAGARVIETNSFGANAARLEKHGLGGKTAEINLAAARLATRAAKGKGAYVAGSVGPLGLTQEQATERGVDRRAVFAEQIGALIEGGVDLLFYETFLDFDELALALEAGKTLGSLPAICSLACPPEGRLPSGLPITEAFAKLRGLGAEVVGLNCVFGPSGLLRLLEELPLEGPLAAYPNAGHPKYHEGRFLYYMTPDYFAESGKAFAAQGANLIGGCCGTRPEHIAALVKALEGLRPITTKPPRSPRQSAPTVSVEPRAFTPPAPPEEEESILDRVAAGKTVILTELDPPKTLELEKYFRGAQVLTEAGSDAITLADNSLAILRVSNFALSAMLKQQYGILPLLHLSCRDRNLLGLQSELLGMAALGMRHVLPLTGDPAKVGDHPAAASVYDVNSIDLMKIIARLNEGFNYAGKSVKTPTRFVIGCTFNPNARNLDAQISRLERKIAAGAQYVMTQPVFDPALVEETARRTARLGVPIFIGVWPLLNGRQAEFLHNEVPGIVIPENVRTAMAGKEGVEGRTAGLEIGREVTRAVLDHFPGVYLITPFLAYETTAELAHFVRSR